MTSESQAEPEPPEVPIERIRLFVVEQATNLETLLLRDRARAKQALCTYFNPLMVSPKQTKDGLVFTVAGGVNRFLA